LGSVGYRTRPQAGCKLLLLVQLVVDVGRVGGETVTSCPRHVDLARPLLAEFEAKRRPKRRRCRHRHVSADARAQCERRLARAVL
jgi:hypothetical protein